MSDDEMEAIKGSKLITGIRNDCEFVVGPKSFVIRANREVLTIASPYFENIFGGKITKDDPEQEPIRVPNVAPSAFMNLLSYLYTSKLQIKNELDAFKLYEAAIKCEDSILAEKCTYYLKIRLKPDNVCEMYKHSLRYGTNEIIQESLKIFSTYTNYILCVDLSEDLEKILATMFALDELNINSELDLFKAIERFSVQKLFKSNDISRLRAALYEIRFLAMTPYEFSIGPGKSTVLSDNEKCIIRSKIDFPRDDIKMPEIFSTSIQRRYPILFSENLELFDDVWFCHRVPSILKIYIQCNVAAELMGFKISSQDSRIGKSYEEDVAVSLVLPGSSAILAKGVLKKIIQTNSSPSIWFDKTYTMEGLKEYVIKMTYNKCGYYRTVDSYIMTMSRNNVSFTIGLNKRGVIKGVLYRKNDTE